MSKVACDERAAKRFARRDSLMRQASIDREQNEGLRRQNTIRSRKELERSSTMSKLLLNRLDDNGVELIRNASEQGPLPLLLILNCSAGNSEAVLNSALQKFYAIGLQLQHLDTRTGKSQFCVPYLLYCDANAQGVELRIGLVGYKSMFLDALTKLVVEKSIERIELRHDRIIGSRPKDDKVIKETVEPEECKKTIWFPSHVSDIDNCAHVVVKYEPTEDPKHPGYGDTEYIKRRDQLNQIANSYHHGDTVPYVEYLSEEHSTWRIAYTKLKELRETHTCAEYQQNIAEMESFFF